MTQSTATALVFVFWIVFLVVALPFVFNGFLAKSRGKSVFLMLLLTIFFSWILTLILSLMPVENRRKGPLTERNYKPFIPLACLVILSTVLIYYWDQNPDTTSTLKNKIYMKASSFKKDPNSNNHGLKTHESNDLNFDSDDVQQAMNDIFARRNVNKDDEGMATNLSFHYEIMLVSGGKIYTDNAEIGENYVKYKSDRGLVISLNRDEIESMKRIKN